MIDLIDILNIMFVYRLFRLEQKTSYNMYIFAAFYNTLKVVLKWQYAGETFFHQ